MFRVYDCLVEDHELSLVALAAAICLFSCVVAFQVYGRARVTSHGSRLGWTMVMGLVAGIGTWATHFVAMLAFQPQAGSAFEPKLTALSLLLAIGTMACGGVIAATSDRSGRLVGGALVGAGVGAMHFTGMAGFLVAGQLVWDPVCVTASLAVGIGLGAMAFHVAGDGRAPLKLFLGSVLLTLGIASLHFSGMAAVRIVLDPSIAIPDQAIRSGYLVLAIAAVTALVVGIGLSSVLIDIRARKGEAARLRDFADAAVEGLVICEQGKIVDANESLCELAKQELGALRGRDFSSLLTPETVARMRMAGGGAVEGELVQADGSAAAVVVFTRELKAGGQTRTVFAIRDLRDQKAAERRIRYLAHHDALTGLANRVSFGDALAEHLDRATREGTRVALLCLDLDHFKSVNDLHGHLAGDEVLVAMSRRMAHLLAKGDVLGRLGGDEFAIVRRLTEEAEPATLLAERLIAALSGEMEIAAGQVAIGASIGLAIGPADGDSPDRLLANADTALYRAKSEGRGRFRCFEPEMDAQVRERHELAADLRRAIPRDELTLYYQPQVKGSTGELTGFEALVRWHHPRRGLVSPADFIPLAEDTGQIIALGEWVLRSACREAATWHQPLKIAVNLSPLQFQQPNLPELVHGILLETGLASSRLELEITETAIIRDMQRAVSILRRLKSLGVRIAMDDFGTGYSSLGTLQAFPFDTLKIDRSFVGKVETQSQAAVIVRAVLSLGRSLGMAVVAEGVETQGQMEFLRGEACDEVQGYLFGKPQSIQSYSAAVYDVARPGELRQVA